MFDVHSGCTTITGPQSLDTAMLGNQFQLRVRRSTSRSPAVVELSHIYGDLDQDSMDGWMIDLDLMERR